MEIYTVEGTGLNIPNEVIGYLQEQATRIRVEQQKRHEEMRDWELLQLSKHITQLRDEFNDSESLKLLEATLQTNAMLVRGDYES